MVASPPWWRGPQVRAPWHHGGHGAVDAVRPMVPPGAQAFVGTQECTQIGENGLSEPFWVIRVHCCVVVTQPDRRGRHRSCGGGSRAVPRRGASWFDASRKGAVCGPRVAQNALFRHITARETRDQTPPASLRGTMESGSTGQTRSSNPPPGCGGVRRGPAGPGLGPDCTEKRSLGRGPR